MLRAFVLLLISAFIFSCTEERIPSVYSGDEYDVITSSLNLPRKLDNYELVLGEHYLPKGKTFSNLNNYSQFEKQQLNFKATLGRVLFYDTNLSSDRSVSCASCHKQENAFSDTRAFSDGVSTRATTRNSLALATTLSFKISYNPVDQSQARAKFSWDDSSANLGMQIRRAFNKDNEMNISDEELIARVNEQDFYPILFENAFGDQNVTREYITEAITAFVDAISATDSKFDEGLEFSSQFSSDNSFYNFTEEENMGKLIYNQHCASCHTDKHNFTVKSTANNGLDLQYTDRGIGGRLNDPSKFGVFKVPFLRNVGITAPYMHDGRFATLEEVVEHYNSGIQNHQNLSEELKDESGNPKKLNLKQSEKDALVAYLNTLTDTNLIKDQRFSDPFK